MALTNFYEKQTKKWTGQITLNGSNPDISSDTVTVYFIDQSGTIQIEKDADVSLGNGQYEFTLDINNTNVTPGYYSYEIWWEVASDDHEVLETGEVYILDSKAKS